LNNLDVNFAPDRDMITYNSCTNLLLPMHHIAMMGPAGVALHVSVQQLLLINYGEPPAVK